jgi:hypothetical protein
MANNNPSASAVQGDFQASTVAENHQHLFSSNNLSNSLADDHSNGLPNPLVDPPRNTHPQNTFKDPFASSRPIDPCSLLFLHNGDNLEIILVPQPLTGENYSTWIYSMLVALSAKNKLCFIDGSLSKPFVFESYFHAWTRCNDLVVSWIFNSISKEIYNTVIYITFAYDV